ncbi:MAG: glucosidase family protein [Thermoplasmatota archaeon]
MRLGRYSVDLEGVRTAWRMRATRASLDRAQHVRHAGTPSEIARDVLRGNAGGVLRSGACHFLSMWIVDTGVAFRGAQRVLPETYLRGQVDRMLAVTRARKDRVPVCLSPRLAHDIPWPRADGLPWLLEILDALGGSDADDGARRAYDRWRADVLDERTHAIRRDVWGDWVDTVPRPSSTYNNLCALRAHALAAKRDWPGASERRDALAAWLLRERFRDGRFVEDATGGDALAADAQVFALASHEIPRETRERVADTLAASAIAHPLALRARDPPRAFEDLPPFTQLVARYHDSTWMHLGWLYALGLKRLGRDWRAVAAPLETVVAREGTFLETLEPDGSPHASRWIATERDFTMSAGLYLELVGA